MSKLHQENPDMPQGMDSMPEGMEEMMKGMNPEDMESMMSGMGNPSPGSETIDKNPTIDEVD